MLGLTIRLAQTNLRKNRRLYYPYALMTVLSTAIAYIFASLAFHPNLGQVKGAAGVTQVLSFGMIVVIIAVAMMIFYANGFVMKRRSKEFGVYSILGLEKKHLLLMTFLETVLFSVITVGLGLIFGALLDRLFYALLLKAMQVEVVLASAFQWSNVLLIAGYLLGIFLLVCLFNAGKLGLTDSLKMVQDRKRGDCKGMFLSLQSVLGLVLLIIAYTMAQRFESPLQAITNFFIAVLLVIVATYLLFNAGIIRFLYWLKKRPTYYYKPANFISVSNLIFRMRKNAMGLATIAILSTMFLVTLVGGLNIYIGGKDTIERQFPHDFSIEVGRQTRGNPQEIETWAEEMMTASAIPIEGKEVHHYQRLYLSEVTDEQLRLSTEEESWERNRIAGAGVIIDEKTYQQLSGQSLNLSANQVALYSQNQSYQKGQALQFEGKELQVAEVLDKDFTLGHIPNYGFFLFPQYLVLVVQDLNSFADFGEFRHYMGFETSLSEDEQVEAQEGFMSTVFSSDVWDNSLDDRGLTGIVLSYRAWSIRDFLSFAGSLLFIGLLLSLVFLMAVILVIYFKQISEAYEDRSRFVIMQKVGLDEDQTRQSIRKQLLTVFFLPLIFAFVHLGFAYKMLSAILLTIGVVNVELMFQVTLFLCGAYLLIYLLVYAITTGAYKKIIRM